MLRGLLEILLSKRSWWVICLGSLLPSVLFAPSLFGGMFGLLTDVTMASIIAVYWYGSFVLPFLAHRYSRDWDRVSRMKVAVVVALNGCAHGGLSWMFWGFQRVLLNDPGGVGPS
jgi:hypothetical protein